MGERLWSVFLNENQAAKITDSTWRARVSDEPGCRYEDEVGEVDEQRKGERPNKIGTKKIQKDVLQTPKKKTCIVKKRNLAKVVDDERILRPGREGAKSSLRMEGTGGQCNM